MTDPTAGEPGATPLRPPPQGVPHAAPVTDADRNRYGVLLDRAFERGLIDLGEYHIRLQAIAESHSIEELQRLVTEFPVFEVAQQKLAESRSRKPRGRTSTSGYSGVVQQVDPSFGGQYMNRSPHTTRKSPPIGALVALGAVVIVALVVLALLTVHLVHSHGGGSAGAVLAAASLLG